MTLRLQNKSKHKLAWLFPSGLVQLSQLYGPTMPSAEALLLNHTSFRLHRPFLSNSVIASLRSHSLTGPTAGIATLCGLTAQGASSRWKLAVCQTCITEDYKNGVQHWKAAHIFPGLALCPFHLEPLYTFCGNCVKGFRRSRTVWIPRSICVCGEPLVQVRVLKTAQALQIEIAISTMVRKILVEKMFDSVEQSSILAAISLQAKKLGFGTVGGRATIEFLLKERIGQETLSAYKLVTSPQSRFHTSLLGTILSRNPVHNLILIYALFGDLGPIVDYAKGGAPDGETTHFYETGPKKKRRARRGDRYRHLYGKTATEIESMRQRFRTELLSLKTHIPLLKRRDLRSAGKREAYAFLLRFDSCWLDEVLPTRPFSTSGAAFNQLKRSATDASIAAHVRIRRDGLMAARLPARITHTRLMQGHPLQSFSKVQLHVYPLAMAALEECIESLGAWHIRETRILMDEAIRTSPDLPFDRNLDERTLNVEKRIYLNRKIREWLREKAFT